ncbi:hypothetical protein EVAR_61104_1 [Eumeta japonica]|uniref:Uncharacterized protein n=1 Tax=Eumeta variegata TaxID=151549 RepID=A0A4C1YQC2_EUMVA|nr:hypothetical protein EVAR_61104_1 [Eumeta japonica]
MILALVDLLRKVKKRHKILQKIDLIGRTVYALVADRSRPIHPILGTSRSSKSKGWEREELTLMCVVVFTLDGHRGFEHDCANRLKPSAVGVSCTLAAVARRRLKVETSTACVFIQKSYGAWAL